MADGPVTTRQEGDVLVATIDDDKRNAITFEVAEGLGAALDQAEADGVGAVVIAGRDGTFSAGFHLPTMRSERVMDLLTVGGNLAHRIFSFPKPVVYAVTGHALAMGAVLLLCPDARIGARGDFKIGLNEVRIGLALPPLASQLARFRLDPRRLNDATQLAGIYGPDEAVEVGYLDRVVESDQVVKEAVATAQRYVDELDANAFAATRRFVRGPMIAQLGDMAGAADPTAGRSE